MAKATKAFYLMDLETHLQIFDIKAGIEGKHYIDHVSDTPIYAVPTTAGTGSEMTKWATIWNSDEDKKYSIEAPWLYPKIAYLVSELTLTLSPRVTLSTGLDALSHAIEAFWAVSTNIEVQRISLNAISLISDSLPRVLTDQPNRIFRDQLLTGANLAGLAFSQTRTTAAHSISYPLSSRFRIDHGIAVSMVLPEVMKYNFEKCPDIMDVLRAMRLNSVDEFRVWISNLASPYVKFKLADYGIQFQDIDMLVSLSATKGRMDNNPVELSTNDIRLILLSLL